VIAIRPAMIMALLADVEVICCKGTRGFCEGEEEGESNLSFGAMQ
jgi:hypothetical protein